MISIIIPIYNRKELLYETLNSLVKQSSENWECIIVDDGSTDGSDLIATEFCSKDHRLNYYKRTTKQKGAAVCRNIGAMNASGEWLMFLDSDDLLDIECIDNRLKKATENSMYRMLVFNSIAFDEKGNKVFWNIATEEDDLSRFLRLDGVWNISSVLYKTDFVKAHLNFFKETLPFLQDWDLAVRLLIKNEPYLKFLNQQPDVLIRRHSSESISQKGWNMNAQLQLKFSIISSFYPDIRGNRILEQNLSIPLINIIKEFIGKNKYKMALSMLKSLKKHYKIKFADIFYLFVVYRFNLAKNKNFIIQYTFTTLHLITNMFINKTLHFPQYDILKHPYNEKVHK